MVGIADAHDWFHTAMSHTDFAALPVERRHIGSVQHLPLHHGDPFDRLLISQAIIERRTFVSRDSNVPSYPVAVLWD